MRIKFIYKINKVPLDYRKYFLSLIKEAVKDENLFNDERRTKPFCFSVFFERSKIKDEVIEIEGNTHLFISTPDIPLFITIYNGLINEKLKEFKFPGSEILKRKKSLLIREKNINKDEVCFKTISPVIIVNKDKKPVLHPQIKGSIKNVGNIIIDEDIFLKELKYSIANYVNNDLEFIPVDIKKEVIKHSIGEHLKETGKIIKLVGFKGKFIMRGEKSDLQKIYQLGIGFRRNQGFGMLEVE